MSLLSDLARLIAELILIFVVLTDLILLGSSRLTSTIRLSAWQGMALGFLPLMVSRAGFGPTTLRLVTLGAVLFAMKGFLFPRLLLRALRTAEVRHEIRPIVGFQASILAGIAIVAASFWMGGRLPLPRPAPTPLALPMALSTILIGLFAITTRANALNQVVGYLVMENGIFIFGVALAQEEPFIVEMGVLLDVFVAVFVMGIAIFHIGREFDHIEVDQLSSLKD